MRRRGRPTARNTVRLFDERDVEPLGECNVPRSEEIRRGHAPTCPVSEDERGRRPVAAIQVRPGGAVRSFQLECRHARHTYSMRLLGLALLTILVGSGCGGAAERDIDAARRFDAFPLYWVGKRFESLELNRILGLDGTTKFVTFIYGDCKPHGSDEPSCTPPLQIQVFPLCAHLDVVASAPIWKRRSIRGAPVGAIDSAPVLFTSGAQVKVYRGEGTVAGLPTRALRALRSINQVQPVIAPSGNIPAPAPGVLEGTRSCS